MTVITFRDLLYAIMTTFAIGEEDAKKLANMVIDFFGFDDRIVDNALHPEERRLFYRLQEKGLVSPEREETTLHGGTPWRIHYWRLEKQKILCYRPKQIKSVPTKKIPVVVSSSHAVYDDMSNDLWTVRKTPDL